MLTGTFDADSGRGRLLTGVAVSLSEGERMFGHPGVDKGSVASTLTTAGPYARFRASLPQLWQLRM